MSWKCIKCETSNSDNEKICRICDLERFYTQSELDAKLDEETLKFQSPVRREQNGRWKVYNGPQYLGQELSKISRLTDTHKWRPKHVN